MMDGYIQLTGVSKIYSDTAVVRLPDAVFEPGTVTNIMGPSGCGKTTLLRLVAGLETPSEGEIRRPERVAFVFQEDRLCEDFSALANIRLVTGKRYDTQYIRSQLERAGLAGFTDVPVRTLSGGMKRRVAILRALLFDAPAVLLDEAFKGLDEKLLGTVIAMVKEHTEGRTVLSVTHRHEEARLLGGRIWDMGAEDKN